MKSNIILAVGISGLAAFTAGLPVDHFVIKNALFIIGGTLLAISSYWEKEYFFSCIEGIAMTEAILALFGVSMLISSIVLVVMVAATIMIMSRIRKFDFKLCLGIAGLVLLSLGIIVGTNVIMVAAGVVLCLYSYLSARSGYNVGWVFLALNLIFTGVALFSIHWT
ncbi:hypothetical protein P0136_09655 [Lentisphaerota bacterium ZTH]|nr:hypothetical protein P0136_09655 [Lentisphaerota bacterium ZTH]